MFISQLVAVLLKGVYFAAALYRSLPLLFCCVEPILGVIAIFHLGVEMDTYIGHFSYIFASNTDPHIVTTEPLLLAQ